MVLQTDDTLRYPVLESSVCLLEHLTGPCHLVQGWCTHTPPTKSSAAQCADVLHAEEDMGLVERIIAPIEAPRPPPMPKPHITRCAQSLLIVAAADLQE